MNMQDAYAKIAELDADKVAVAEAMKEPLNKMVLIQAIR